MEDSSQKKINTGSILAVDSSTGTADHLKGILKRGGIEVTTVEDGETALKFYEEGKFDVVVSEIPVKPVDGFTLLRRLRKLDRNAIVILMSEEATKETAILKGNDFIGDVGFPSRLPASATVTAVKPQRLVAWTKKELKNTLDGHAIDQREFIGICRTLRCFPSPSKLFDFTLGNIVALRIPV